MSSLIQGSKLTRDIWQALKSKDVNFKKLNFQLYDQSIFSYLDGPEGHNITLKDFGDICSLFYLSLLFERGLVLGEYKEKNTKLPINVLWKSMSNNVKNCASECFLISAGLLFFENVSDALKIVYLYLVLIRKIPSFEALMDRFSLEENQKTLNTRFSNTLKSYIEDDTNECKNNAELIELIKRNDSKKYDVMNKTLVKTLIQMSNLFEKSSFANLAFTMCQKEYCSTIADMSDISNENFNNNCSFVVFVPFIDWYVKNFVSKIDKISENDRIYKTFTLNKTETINKLLTAFNNINNKETITETNVTSIENFPNDSLYEIAVLNKNDLASIKFTNITTSSGCSFRVMLYNNCLLDVLGIECKKLDSVNDNERTNCVHHQTKLTNMQWSNRLSLVDYSDKVEITSKDGKYIKMYLLNNKIYEKAMLMFCCMKNNNNTIENYDTLTIPLRSNQKIKTSMSKKRKLTDKVHSD